MISNILAGAFFILLMFVIPAGFTFINFWNFFVKNPKKRFFPKIFLVLSMGIGGVEYALLKDLTWECAGDYMEVIYNTQYHNTIDSTHLLSFILPLVVGIVGLLMIGLVSPKSMSPVVSCLAIASVLIGNIVFTIYGIQLLGDLRWESIFSNAMEKGYLYLYHVDVFVLSAYHIREQIKKQVELIQERNTQFQFAWVNKLYQYMSTVVGMRAIAVLGIIPVLAILEIVLIVCGQGPDGMIKAFTMTADWTFSTQIPPPPIEYPGHYLCTVAAGGHKKVVKPTRYGMRLGQPIIVNRQLSVANAFEELIHDRTPRFHKWVRHVYDTYGYPLSRVIKTPFQADVIYILMKPLEWMFLLVLYLFDANPESRIAKQYQWKE
ncbi:MAG: hypothetical protein Q4D51_09860 [Eubacteriales bacterium]|nr:hypothetical protein [Eubacteriales bacterium]